MSTIAFLALGVALCLAAHGSVALSDHPAVAGTLALGHGTRITDADGRTLYTFDTDLSEPGASKCVDSCAEMRPPLLATSAPGAIPDGWGMIARPDGARQWTYGGRPLYRYARDLEPGAAFGAADGWNIAFEPMVMPPEMSIADTVIGQVLATADLRPLYVRRGADKSAVCDRVCRQTWRPMAASWTARDFGDFGVVARDDGIHQWTYKGQPLFTYAGDAGAGALNGHDLDGLWQARVLEPAPPVPGWVTVVGSDGGELYADRNGMALYRLMIDQNGTEQSYMGGSQCDAACLEKYWTPVAADSKQPRIGYWSVIESGRGGWQWAYKGMPLYLLNVETRPGELYYTTYRQFQWMKPIMYRLPSLQGVF